MMDEDDEHEVNVAENDDVDDIGSLASENSIPSSQPKPPSSCFIPVSPVSSCQSIHPMQILQYRASVLSGVSLERAFQIDDMRLGNVLGEYYVSELTNSFYRRVLEDPNSWFRDMFKSDFEDLSQNLADYVLQRLGGSTYYTDRNGYCSLIFRHSKFEMTARAAEKWINHMEDALSSMDQEIFNEEIHDALIDFFRHSAYFLVAAQEMQWQQFQMGSLDQ